jgi:hypothetical protein
MAMTVSPHRPAGPLARLLAGTPTTPAHERLVELLTSMGEAETAASLLKTFALSMLPEPGARSGLSRLEIDDLRGRYLHVTVQESYPGGRWWVHCQDCCNAHKDSEMQAWEFVAAHVVSDCVHHGGAR